MLVFKDVERAHTVAALASNLRNETAGFSFAEDENEHGFTSFQLSVKNLPMTDYSLEDR